MGLAERFKDKLEQKDIFQKDKYITKEVKDTKPEEQQKQCEQLESEINLLTEVNTVEAPKTKPQAKFEELETEIIGKIRKTPYWADYSTIKQENMISKYFDNKVQKNKYSKIEYSTADKLSFIQDILTLSNYR